MKKIILLIVILFGITGCYDYQELNNRAIVSGISIDYEEDQYIVNYEILNNKKSNTTEGQSNKAYLVEGTGETIVEAFINAGDKISKETYLSHLKVLVLSEIAAKEKLRDIVDYMLREPNIRNIFLPVIAKNCSAKEILESATEEEPVISEKINSLIDNNKYNENTAITIDFDGFMDKLEDERIDPVITSIDLVDGLPSLAGIAIFESGKLKSILSLESASIYNVLTNESANHHLKIPCEDKDGYIIINLYQNKKTDFEITEDTLKISSKLKASVLKDSCGYNFRDNQIYETLSQKFANVLEKEYQDFWKIIQIEKSDVLGIQKKYYQKKRQNLPNWTNLKLKTAIQIEINKNGLTFEVKEK